jgi:ankyrin repeat protein
MRSNMTRFLTGSIGLLVTISTSVAAADTRLIDALKAHDAAALASLLIQHADVNARQGDGSTALHWAVHFDDLKTTGLLIRAGARVDVANDLGATPLYVACTNRNAAIVRLLLSAGANANAALLSGETVLMNCARTGNDEAVKALLARGADVNRRERSHDQTALMWAAAQQHPEVVAALLGSGADVLARSRVYNQTVTSEVTQRAGREELNYTVPRGGSTALLLAARSGDARSAALLLGAGGDVDEKLPDGMSALVVAAYSGHRDVATLLLDWGANPDAAEIGYTALHAAVLRGDLELVKKLLAAGANPNERITKGTPLRRLSQDFELPKTLLGATPYLLAAKYLEVEIMAALVDAGADPRLPLKDGTTPLMAAAGMGSAHQANRRNLTAFDGGQMEDESLVFDAVTAALRFGAEVNATSGSGDTALHSAASFGYDTVVQLLVDKGARVDAKNGRGQTPLGVLTGGTRVASGTAASGSRSIAHPTTAELLRKLGAVE